MNSKIENFNLALKALGLNNIPEHIVVLIYELAVKADNETLKLDDVKSIYDKLYEQEVNQKTELLIEKLKKLNIENPELESLNIVNLLAGKKEIKL